MSGPARRSFIAAGEIPGLVGGALRGEAVALRRILGARRSGRWGILLAGAGLALASPSPAFLALLAGVHLALALRVLIPPGRAPSGAGPGEALALSLWTTGPLLLAAAPLRLVLAGSPVPALAAIVLGHLCVWRGLRRGLA